MDLVLQVFYYSLRSILPFANMDVSCENVIWVVGSSIFFRQNGFAHYEDTIYFQTILGSTVSFLVEVCVRHVWELQSDKSNLDITA
jgi:hypothetical protein